MDSWGFRQFHVAAWLTTISNDHFMHFHAGYLAGKEAGRNEACDGILYRVTTEGL